MGEAILPNPKLNQLNFDNFLKMARAAMRHVFASNIKEIDDSKSATHAPRLRAQFLSLVFLGGFAVLGSKLFYLTILRPFNKAESNARAEAQKYTMRLDIKDRNGETLATTLPSYGLYANPKQIWDAVETARALRTVFPDMPEAELISKLSSKKSMVFLKHKLTPIQKQAVWDLAQPGLAFETEPRRVYPNGHLAGHLLGGINDVGKGIMGLEASFDDYLKGADNQELISSIDAKVQHIVESELENAANEYNAVSGSAIVMNVNNGEILAATSWPFYDPNFYGKDQSDKHRNNYLNSVFEMGSTFKAFTFAVALQDKKITPETVFDVSHKFKVGDYEISDFHGTKPALTAREILEHSSNIGTALIAKQVGFERLIEFYKQLGLTSRVNSEVKSANPILPQKWGYSESATAAFGHGLAVTPLAMAAAYGAISNGGIYIKPTFIKKPDGAQASGTQIISPETSKILMSLLRDVVKNGTGKNADAPYYDVGGKTGTAEIASKNGYDKNRNNSSFAAIFPSSNPQYVVLVFLSEPKSKYGGAAKAGEAIAPAINKIISRIGPILGVAPLHDIAAKETSANEEKPQIKSESNTVKLPNAGAFTAR